MDRARTSLDTIFQGYLQVREAGTPQQAYSELRRLVAQEAPALITLGLMKMGEVVNMLSSLEEKAAGTKSKAGTVSDLRSFLEGLTGDEGEPQLTLDGEVVEYDLESAA